MGGTFWILDEREVWWQAACLSARRHGWTARRIYSGDVDAQAMSAEDLGFIRPHADWRRLPTNRDDYAAMAARMPVIQDALQVQLYEDKRGQARLWADEWMPETRIFDDEDRAQWYVANADYPLVSKADVGASSVNVRILRTPKEAREHVAALFGAGVEVHHGASCPNTRQKGYALLQRFIPHDVTYRVNAIGDARAVFFRYCYPDRPVAQTGNVEPAFEMNAELEDLLDWSDRFFLAAGTKWCAIDVLRDHTVPGGQWRLLETSLAWPWPSPGRCNEGAIFRSGGKRWIQMFDVMFDQYEAGAWAAA